MHFEITYKNEMVDEVRLVPDPEDNPDYLYNLSNKLRVVNPAIQFREDAMAGKFKDQTDPEYEVMLKRIKYICELFFKDGKYDQNIFMLANLMMEHILKTDTSFIELYKDKKNA
ncbi:MAG: hypothetical protein IKO61_05120 [Lachnospiraceae bacterium]|nr:hypothetical protein [Lachnospiraceae bacterium]